MRHPSLRNSALAIGAVALVTGVPSTLGPLPSEIAANSQSAIPSGRADIPPFELFYDSANGFNQVLLLCSNRRRIPIDITLTLFQEDGSVVHDGTGAGPVATSDIDRITIYGAQLSYSEPATGPSTASFTLPPNASCTLYIRAGNLPTGMWTGGAHQAHIPTGFKKGIRGYGNLEWRAQGPASSGAALIANGTCIVHESSRPGLVDALVLPLPINGGRAF